MMFREQPKISRSTMGILEFQQNCQLLRVRHNSNKNYGFQTCPQEGKIQQKKLLIVNDNIKVNFNERG